MLPEITLDSKYLVTDEGTSDGTQIKYYVPDTGMWYKADRYGGEGAAEELASDILRLSNLSKEEYVQYSRIIINGQYGCCSPSFLKNNDESFVTFYRLYSNITGRDLSTVTSKMVYDDAIEYTLGFFKDNTGLDLHEYLANVILFDSLILNEDRHFNNFGLIYDGNHFRPAPIFDNGKSLFVGNSRYNPQGSMAQNKKVAFAKSFSGSFEQNQKYMRKYATLQFDYTKIFKCLENKNLSTDNVYSRLNKLMKINSLM